MVSKLGHADSESKYHLLHWDDGHSGTNKRILKEKKVNYDLLHGKPVNIPYSNVNTEY